MAFERLLNAPEEQRNPRWEEDFFKAFIESKIHLVHPDPKPGPDGWPYLMVQNEANKYPAEPALKVLHWLHDKGIGLVLNAHKKLPDYIFTYGMVWNFKESGRFISSFVGTSSTTLEIKSSENYYYGYPSASYLPDYAKKILKDFLLQQGILQPKLVLLSKDQKAFDLCFSLESFGSPPQREHQGILEAISWFLPSHYSLCLISEKGLPTFQAL